MKTVWPNWTRMSNMMNLGVCVQLWSRQTSDRIDDQEQNPKLWMLDCQVYCDEADKKRLNAHTYTHTRTISQKRLLKWSAGQLCICVSKCVCVCVCVWPLRNRCPANEQQKIKRAYNRKKPGKYGSAVAVKRIMMPMHWQLQPSVAIGCIKKSGCWISVAEGCFRPQLTTARTTATCKWLLVKNDFCSSLDCVWGIIDVQLITIGSTRYATFVGCDCDDDNLDFKAFPFQSFHKRTQKNGWLVILFGTRLMFLASPPWQLILASHVDKYANFCANWIFLLIKISMHSFHRLRCRITQRVLALINLLSGFF